jgi:quercetin dioxygenase-like cupin family protein
MAAILRLALVAAAVLTGPALAADPPAPVRTVVQRGPVSGAPNEDLIIATVLMAPGARLAFHTHPGEEAGVVIAGTLKLEIGDKPALLLHPGDSYLVPRGVRHQASAPDGETRVVATFVVDRDKPLATPAP